MELTAFAGNMRLVHVGGQQYPFHFADGELQIGGLTPELARVLIERLEGTPVPAPARAKAENTAEKAPQEGGIIKDSSTNGAPAVGRKEPTVDAEVVKALAGASPAPVAKAPSAPKAKAKGTASAEPPSTTPSEAPGADSAPAKAKSNGASNGKAHVEPAVVDEAPAEPPAPEEVEGEAAADSGVPAPILEAKKLRDVLAYLIDNGVTDTGDLKERCKEFKKLVGKDHCLIRIENLDERVERTLEVMDRA